MKPKRTATTLSLSLSQAVQWPWLGIALALQLKIFRIGRLQEELMGIPEVTYDDNS